MCLDRDQHTDTISTIVAIHTHHYDRVSNLGMEWMWNGWEVLLGHRESTVYGEGGGGRESKERDFTRNSRRKVICSYIGMGIGSRNERIHCNAICSSFDVCSSDIAIGEYT